MLIDTHCHLDFPEFASDLDDVLSRAENAGVKYIINVASSLKGSVKSAELALKYPQIFATAGVHPHHADSVGEECIRKIENIAEKNKKVVAIGEVGLDYYRNISSKENQINCFISFIGLSKRLGLPLVIHAREAAKETFDVLKKEKGSVKGVFHCFSMGKDFIKEVLDLGFYISFTCNVTFDNAHKLRDAVKSVPIERLLLETDAPFLAPQKFRGKRNEPAYLVYLVETLSGIFGMPKGKIEDITTENARRLFMLDRVLSR